MSIVEHLKTVMLVGAEDVGWKSKRLLCTKCVINVAAVSGRNVSVR